jgi:tetratricopeptide (TPR) repeat protein
LLVVPGLLAAQSPEQLFNQGNQLYQQGKIADARDVYESLLGKGYVSGDLYYNLGNACYRTGNLPRAILCYERALRYLPGDEDLKHNLQLANLSITDRIEPIPRLFVWDYWDAVKNWLPQYTLTLVAYGWYVLLMASIAAILLARSYRMRKIAALSTLGTGVVFLFFLAVFAGKLSDINRGDLAIVTAQIVTVKNSPDIKSSDAFVLHGGVKLQVIDRYATWAKIRLADGKVGWMEAGGAEII